VVAAAAAQGHALRRRPPDLDDGSAPVKLRFIVENNHFTQIGKKGASRATGARRIDLAGKP
jgi:hypothetical protein